MQALEEGKRRALLVQRDSSRLAELDKQQLELRSHVLTLREGELDSRLRDLLIRQIAETPSRSLSKSPPKRDQARQDKAAALARASAVPVQPNTISMQ